MHWKLLKKTAVVFLFNVATGVAFAQFAWIDASGVRQYSDRPPPASTPKGRVLKEPAGEPRLDRVSSPPENAPDSTTFPSAPTATPKLPATLAEKNAEFNKRRAEQAEKDRKSEAAVKEAAAKTQNCMHARAYARALASGERIVAADKNGERVFMSDEKRAQEGAAIRRVTDACM